jgi:flap endonuclease-1
MGIHHLHPLLQKYAPKAYKTTHLSNYSYKKVAIDISLYLYKYKAINGDRWLESFILLIQCLRKWDVHCIFIYDGKAPIEKLEEQQRRRDSRDKQGDKVVEIEKQIKEYEETGAIGDLLGELCYVESPSLFHKKDQKKFVLQKAKDKVESMKSMIISITPDDILLSKQLFDVLSIPYVTAPSEAECYASNLCVAGKIDAVLSEDTDVLAYGTPIFLTKIDVVQDTVVEIMYSDILEETGMTLPQFTDLCIMCSCDYNSNIYMIGPEKSFQMLKTYGNIENVIEELKTFKNKDKTDKYTDDMLNVLKYERCREMFTTHPVEFYVPYCGMPDFNQLQEFLFKHSIKYSQMATLKKYLSPRELNFDE